MRCFIALDISDEVRHSISSAIQRVKPLSKGVKWVVPDNVHLTLKFLGEVSEAMVSQIRDGLSSLCSGRSPFTLTVRGTGGFPDLRRPNILWVGIDASVPLRDLNLGIEQAMAGLGFEREKKLFSPHLTLGRVKGTDGLDAMIKEWVVLKDTVFGTIQVDETLLVKSALKPAGAEYSKIGGFKLTGARNAITQQTQ